MQYHSIPPARWRPKVRHCARRDDLMASHEKRRQMALPPFRSPKEEFYFRLVIAVRSAESLAMPVAPHQFDSKPPGLMSDVLAAVETLAV